jgi:ABC-type sugar transport system ATPase subunit
MPEFFRLGDTDPVQRDARHDPTRPSDGVTVSVLVLITFGRALGEYFPRHAEGGEGDEVLRVEGLTVPGKFEDVSFTVRAGEVVGLAGLMGAGRSEVASTLFGIERPTRGRIVLEGREVRVRNPAQAIGLGIGYVPEDRKKQGLVLGASGVHNTSLPILGRLSRFGWVRRRVERRMAREYFDRLRVRTPSLDAIVAGLSGGNQQKIVLAKWLAANSRLLILDEPTRGVDVGAKAEIHTLIGELAARGTAILVISSELPEVISLSERIVVLRSGRVAGELSRGEATEASVLRLMAGVASS